jgi:hypothetical protein
MKGILLSFHMSYQTPSETFTIIFKSACVLFSDSGEYSVGKRDRITPPQKVVYCKSM